MNFSDISLSIEELKEQKKHCPQLFVMSNGCNLMSDTLQFEPEWIKAN